jgi:N-acetyl-anhydromuramyl-L-alanine amidase AmpD
MPLPNIFTQEVGDQIIERIQKLTPQSEAKWGKMNVAQMLAHCNIAYELSLENKHAKPGFITSLLLKLFVKKAVVNEVPYARNSRTAPVFMVVDEKIFEKEKERLIQYIRKVYHMGASAFEGKMSHGFGPLSSTEYNNMFYKHLDHHLGQFGV